MRKLLLTMSALAMLGAFPALASATTTLATGTVNVELVIDKYAAVTVPGTTQVVHDSDNGTAGTYSTTFSVTVVNNTPITVTAAVGTFTPTLPTPATAATSIASPLNTTVNAPGASGNITLTFSNVPAGAAPNTYSGTITVTISG
jgi:hypothetical protein